MIQQLNQSNQFFSTLELPKLAADTGTVNANGFTSMRDKSFSEAVPAEIKFILGRTAYLHESAFLLPLVNLALQFGDDSRADNFSGCSLKGKQLTAAQKSVLDAFLESPSFSESTIATGKAFAEELRDFVYQSPLFGHLFQQVVKDQTISSFRKSLKTKALSGCSDLINSFPRRGGGLTLTTFVRNHLELIAPQLLGGEDEVLQVRHFGRMSDRRSTGSRRATTFYDKNYCQRLIAVLEQSQFQPNDPLLTLLVARLFLDSARFQLFRRVNGYCQAIAASQKNMRGEAPFLTVTLSAASGWFELLGRIHLAENGVPSGKSGAVQIKGIKQFEQEWSQQLSLVSEDAAWLEQLYRATLLFPREKFCNYPNQSRKDIQNQVIHSIRTQALTLIRAGQVGELAELVVAIALVYPKLLRPEPGFLFLRQRGLFPPEDSSRANSSDLCWYLRAGACLGLIETDLLKGFEAKSLNSEWGRLPDQLCGLKNRQPEISQQLKDCGQSFLASALERLLAKIDQRLIEIRA